MADTLGSLCDKLTVVKLKQFHTHDQMKLHSLFEQEQQLCGEIDDFIKLAGSGWLPLERLSFCSNKVTPFDEHNPETTTIGNTFAKLSTVNCNLWHEQEKVYDFENVINKNEVVKQLAVLNLKRTGCIDAIDKQFTEMIKKCTVK